MSKGLVMQILEWPMEVYNDLTGSGGSYRFIAPAAALVVPYMLYGMPNQNMSMQTLAMGYVVGGISYVVASKLESGSGSS